MHTLAWVVLLLGACAGGEGEPDADRDRDGYPARLDCDDGDPAVHPEAPDTCNGVDDDCDGQVDEDPERVWYRDRDGDGFGEGAGEAACLGPEGTSPFDGDCDDADGTAFPGADERCDGEDQDCDGQIDEGAAGAVTRWRDEDADGAGDPAVAAERCEAGDGWVDNDLDCDDADAGSPVFVAIDGRASGSGRVDDPLASVQDAVDRAPGCVVVGPGVYGENLDFGGRDVWVRGRDGSAATTLVGDGTDAVVAFSGGETAARLEGFTVSGGVGRELLGSGSASLLPAETLRVGGGVLVYGGKAELRDVRVTGNGYGGFARDGFATYGLGGGIAVAYGELVLGDVRVDDNVATYGGGLYAGAGAVVEGTRVALEANGASLYGSAYVEEGDVRLDNLVVNAGWDAYWWGGIFVAGGTLALDQATIVDSNVGVAAWAGASVRVTNSLVTHHGAYAFEDAYGYEESDWELRYNDVYGNGYGGYSGVADRTGDLGNIASDPRYQSLRVDGVADDDLHLAAESPAIDAADPAVDDVDGSRGDMGAYGGPEGSGW